MHSASTAAVLHCMCDSVPAATRISLCEYIHICAWRGAETEGPGFGLACSVVVLGQDGHFASLLGMASAPIAGLSHALRLKGAAKQIYVRLSLTALPSSVQPQAHRDLGDGGPCSCIAKGT